MTRKTSRNQLATLLLITISVCIIFALMQGLHDNYGIMTNSLAVLSGTGYGSVSFVIGVGAFLYGFAQPFMGMLALKRSNIFVMILGLVMIVGGLLLTTVAGNFPLLFLSFGVILPIGTTGIAFGILMGAITPMIGEEKAAMVSGIVQASAGVGDALLAPLMQRLIASVGIRWTLILFALPFILMFPIAIWIGHAVKGKETAPAARENTGEHEGFFAILKDAFSDHDYRCIFIGFSTCGFNMSIIEAHLFNQYASAGIPESLSSLTLTVYGVMTMLGALATGFLCTKFKMKNVLGTTYLMRVFISIAFILLPISIPMAFIMTAFLGATGDSTVPPTSGTITRKFGAAKLAVLYGAALVGHQFGAFGSASLGGFFVEHGYGYTPIWIINTILAAIAATASYRIKE